MNQAPSRFDAMVVLAGAALVDVLFGELPDALHPVAGIGRLIAAADRAAPRGDVPELLYGGLLAIGIPAAVSATAAAVERSLSRLPTPVRLPALALALKPAFAVRALLDASSTIQSALERGNLRKARRDSAALVSRETAILDEPLLAAAAIESVAENLTDSVLAPLFAFVLGGLPGAYWYRAVNTLDSMIGYRGHYEYLGKASARLDDGANLIPARLAALLLAAVAPLAGRSCRAAWQGATDNRRVTASPNAGWTMGAVAAALGVQLEKQGHYVLNPSGRRPVAADIGAARRLVVFAATGAFLLAGSALMARMLAARR